MKLYIFIYIYYFSDIIFTLKNNNKQTNRGESNISPTFYYYFFIENVNA